MIEDLLQWDIKKQCAKGKGIIGTPLALAQADKEQGRKTLHSHWQCWTKELCQKLRDQLFDNDEEKKPSDTSEPQDKEQPQEEEKKEEKKEDESRR